jgi:deoxycytidylate deaminase
MIRIASKQARKSTFERNKLGAVIVKGNRVLSTGYNEIRWSSKLRKSSIHAEEAAIVKLLKENRLEDLADASIYISRVCPSGRTGLAKPCHSCEALIKSVGLCKVVYTTDQGTTEEYRC